jgi:colicin import membrane protein
MADQIGSAAPPTAADPFFYGWRDVYRRQPDGTVVWEQVPLTFEDVLHPQEGDHIVQNSLHDRDWDYIGDVLKARFADVPGALVLRDVGVFWDHPELSHHSPDISLIRGVRHEREYWRSFRVAEEGVRPVLIVEIVSPATREADLVTKVAQYHQVGVPFYAIVDREQEDGPPRLLGYRWTPERYVEVPLDEHGRLFLEAAELWLAVRGNRVVLIDAITGEEIPDFTEQGKALQMAQRTLRSKEEALGKAEEQRRAESVAREAAEQRAAAEQAKAAAEAAARDVLESRLRELEAAEQRVAAEQAKAAAEAAARVAAEQRAAAEATARAALEARLRELEAELQRRSDLPPS